MERYDIAIIGGGVIGWSCARSLLAEAPNLSVAVVDKYPAGGMGSTGRAAGGVRAQFSTPVNIAMSLYSIAEFERLGSIVDFRQHGYLFVTASESGEELLKERVRLQRSCGVPVSELSLDDASRLAPMITMDDVRACAFSPTDGYLDPYSLCKEYERFARTAGARAIYAANVEAIESNSATWKDGEVKAGNVVACLGHWSEASLHVPVKPEKHQLAITSDLEDLPERVPMVVDADTSFHFRREGRGLLLGYNDGCHEPAGDIESPYFDYAFLERMAEPALRRLPMLSDLTFDVKRCWAGYYAETPDRHALLGWVGGTLVATGFGGHGIMHSPAAGKAVAEIILRGECTSFDATPLRPDRFDGDEMTAETMVI